jgi:hypothetical protein
MDRAGHAVERRHAAQLSDETRQRNLSEMSAGRGLLAPSDPIFVERKAAAMFARTETCSGSFREPCRWLRVGGLAGVVAAGLVAAGLAGASPASADVKVVHSAKGGELKSGRLVLRGVSGRVAYATSGGSSGTASARRLHRRVFLPGKPATGTLRVAGQRGDGSKFRLSKPRYNAARRTVSYRAKPLAKKRSSGSSARAAGGAINPRPFGAASLSIAPHPTLASGDNGGNNCYATINVGEFTYGDFNLASSSNWDTDSWANSPPRTSSHIWL